MAVPNTNSAKDKNMKDVAMVEMDKTKHESVYIAPDKTVHESPDAVAAHTKKIQDERAALLEEGTYEKRVKPQKR